MHTPTTRPTQLPGRALPAQPNAEELDFVNLDEGANFGHVNNMLGRLGISAEVRPDDPDPLGTAERHLHAAGFDTYSWDQENRLDVHPGQHALFPRGALMRFLDAIDSRNGVSSVDVALAQLAVRSHHRQAEAARLLEQLLKEIADDGPTDKTLYAAKREAES